jgi:hypothetical protein
MILFSGRVFLCTQNVNEGKYEFIGLEVIDHTESHI